ncbi:maltose alpha-D-glucosyltransferase [Rubrobacter taiwanensis]|uniref:Maltokinase n=1 Tax=Rubrobacter taiwanensis TaxID=185139 RepID=A0A4R1BSZ2_9ACTN|nr:maltose alpha-D-glucosyltransferase [Rubrobacter taiwanensis]TCJ20768.1 maltose alpha-D-glucosyltransferase [Rubrobacter taiwanensis]
MLERDPLWYKDAVIYQLHVKAFFDSNDDGMGDFRGLTEKLDYVQDLGVNAIWLMPFYPSPMRDDGYDIAEYKNVHPAYGNMRDFRRFVREAHRRGIRVITELVINHTSDAHPWFQRARRAPKGSAWRNFYVWSDTDQKYAGTRIIFTDTESSNWAWDPVAQQYYWHRFFSHQPDLNHDNPRVFRAMMSVLRFWLDAGVDGLRLDAIPYLIEREGTENENLPETHEILKRMRAEMDARYEDRMFLAEANQWPEDVLPYFGDGDECHMAFHFPLMPRIYMALAQEDRHPITEIMYQTPEIPEICQWAIFLRNHDELTLEMVTDRERDYMYQVYASDPRMRINLGIRRRLAPLVDNDRDRMELLNSLLMSMPGTPVIYYGDELGMGDNIFLGDRDSVRTPMQWSGDRNAGFSRADPARLYLPPIMDPVYGYGGLNVEAQSRNPGSLLNWMKRIISVRKRHRAFGSGTLEFLHPGNRKILAYLREYEDESILCVANLSRSAQPVELDLSRFRGRVPVELMGGSHFPPIGDLPYLLTLPGHGFYWFQLEREAAIPSWHEDVSLPPPELPVLVLSHGPQGQLTARQRAALEREALPEFLSNRRWFAAKGRGVQRVKIIAQATLNGEGGESWLLVLIRAYLSRKESQLYLLPLAVAWEDGDYDPLQALMQHVLAKVRRKARVGVLYDAFADDGFCRAAVAAIGEGREIPFLNGTLRFSPTSVYEEPGGGELSVRRAGEQTNTSVILGERMILKAYRLLREEGVNPDLEIGRFLTEKAGFRNTPSLAGYIEYASPDVDPTTVALLQWFVPNQGDGWSYTLDYLQRHLENRLMLPQEESETGEEEEHAFFMNLVRTLGLRTGELYCAFAGKTQDPAFDPEPVSRKDVAAWTGKVVEELEETFELLKQRRGELQEETRPDVERLLQRKDELAGRVAAAGELSPRIVKTRHHGDYHLGQVLVVSNDFHIIDFEGEPARPLSERRAKHCPLRDVAGMLRSFNYAAYSALFALNVEREDQLRELEAASREWERRTREAFMEGYVEGIDGCPSYPDDPEQAQNLIDLFTLEKALYEVRYELNNRPDWIGIPVRGILDLLEAGAGKEEA